jgi:hypothetical protein
VITFKRYILEQDNNYSLGGKIVEKHFGVRNLPLNDRLKNALTNGLAGTNLNWFSFSGGQPASGPRRVGGPRHNNGNASDGEFVDVRTNKSLDADNPSERFRIGQALSKLKQSGITGFGWDSASTGNGKYMGSRRFHLDVYGPGVWGSSLTSKTAASWLVNAIGGIPTGASMAQGDEYDVEADKASADEESPDNEEEQDYDSPVAALGGLSQGLATALKGIAT